MAFGLRIFGRLFNSGSNTPSSGSVTVKTTATITVRDSYGNYVSGVQIVLTDGTEEYIAYTDADGTATVRGVEGEQYTITVSGDGLEESVSQTWTFGESLIITVNVTGVTGYSINCDDADSTYDTMVDFLIDCEDSEQEYTEGEDIGLDGGDSDGDE